MSAINKFLKQVLLSAACVVVLLLGIMVWVSLVEKIASGRAEAFCNETPVGQNVAVLSERIAASRADNKHLSRIFKNNDTPYWVPVIFAGVPPFSRHICDVYVDLGKVSSKRIIYLD